MRLFQRGLAGWLRGRKSDEAIAAGCNVAEVLVMIRAALTE